MKGPLLRESTLKQSAPEFEQKDIVKEDLRKSKTCQEGADCGI